jgi:cell division protein FtsB
MSLLSCLIRFTRTAALRDVQNQLREDVNALQVENNKLSASNTRLETQVIRYVKSEANAQLVSTLCAMFEILYMKLYLYLLCLL